MADYKLITIKLAQAERPKFEEKKGKGYIEFGTNNDYPKFLLGLYSESPKHGAIIKGKANYIFGKGFEGAGSANSAGESWNCVLKKAVQDDEIFSGYYLQIAYNLLGDVKDVFHLEFHKVRTDKTRSKFFVKKDWADNKERARDYPAFDGKYDPGHPVKILFVSQYNPAGDVYPLPNYFQGLNYIEADIHVSRHILGNAKDGFVGSTLINMNNGEPMEEDKGAVERDLKKKFTGSEGERIVLAFNKSKDNAVEILPLSTSMLTKEDFTNVNNLIQQEIFASHQITSPMLFGIKTEGQLGGRNEIVDAYEIFNNTYVNERQQAHEDVFNRLINLKGVTGTFKITPVEPLGFSLKDDILAKILPREYFLDKLSVDQKYYGLPPAEGSGGKADASGAMAVNSNLAGMSGKQFQHLERVVRKYKKGTITRDQAAMMLRNSFGLSEEDIIVMLDADSMDQQFASQDEIDFEMVEQFAQFGESKDDYEVLTSKPTQESHYFADVKELNELEANVVNLIKKDKRVTPEVMATVLKKDVSVINKVLTGLVKAGVIAAVESKVGEDMVTERSITGKTGGEKPTVTEILLRYSYDGPQDSRNRPFCAKMMELNRLYSRADIETISARLGYSVWDRRGGWMTQADGSKTPYCRHQWNTVTVVKKS